MPSKKAIGPRGGAQAVSTRPTSVTGRYGPFWVVSGRFAGGRWPVPWQWPEDAAGVPRRSGGGRRRVAQVSK